MGGSLVLPCVGEALAREIVVHQVVRLAGRHEGMAMVKILGWAGKLDPFAARESRTGNRGMKYDAGGGGRKDMAIPDEVAFSTVRGSKS